MAAGGLEILHLHAQGGMAEVYRARATDEHGKSWDYAVKRMLPELLKDAEMMRMFLEEQRVAACLVHDNIVRVYDVARTEGQSAAETFIVMEFLEGRDLSEVIEAADKMGRTLPVWFAIHVAKEVCKALHYATTQARDKSGRLLGLIHRDITPHNLFITRDGAIKLTDFGVARVETAEVRTKAGIIKGKFGYMSPEQLTAKQLDPRSDLYNIGICIYETLTGSNLFTGASATAYVASMMANVVPALDAKLRVPIELDQLMRRSLAKRVEERPVSALAFDAELSAIAGRYNLHATHAHVAGELVSLFPELRTPPPPPPKEQTKWRALTTQKPLSAPDVVAARAIAAERADRAAAAASFGDGPMPAPPKPPTLKPAPASTSTSPPSSSSTAQRVPSNPPSTPSAARVPSNPNAARVAANPPSTSNVAARAPASSPQPAQPAPWASVAQIVAETTDPMPTVVPATVDVAADTAPKPPAPPKPAPVAAPPPSMASTHMPDTAPLRPAFGGAPVGPAAGPAFARSLQVADTIPPADKRGGLNDSTIEIGLAVDSGKKPAAPGGNVNSDFAELAQTETEVHSFNPAATPAMPKVAPELTPAPTAPPAPKTHRVITGSRKVIDLDKKD